MRSSWKTLNACMGESFTKSITRIYKIELNSIPTLKHMCPVNIHRIALLSGRTNYSSSVSFVNGSFFWNRSWQWIAWFSLQNLNDSPVHSQIRLNQFSNSLTQRFGFSPVEVNILRKYQLKCSLFATQLLYGFRRLKI